MSGKTDITVYAHWQGMQEPKTIGLLSAQQVKGRKSFSFTYEPSWIASNEGWRLSPAFDLNPLIDKNGLSLNIDTDNNALEYDLAKSVGIFFRLEEKKMNLIIDEIKATVSSWKKYAKEIGISRAEQNIMEPAFRV
jgi:hypothetical protein